MLLQYIIIWYLYGKNTIGIYHLTLPQEQNTLTNGKLFSIPFTRVYSIKVTLEDTSIFWLLVLQTLISFKQQCNTWDLSHDLNSNFYLINTIHVTKTHYSRSALNITYLQTENMLLPCLIAAYCKIYLLLIMPWGFFPRNYYYNKHIFTTISSSQEYSSFIFTIFSFHSHSIIIFSV